MSKPEKIIGMVGVQDYKTVEGGKGCCFLKRPDSLRRFFLKNDPANFGSILVGDPFWGITDRNTWRAVGRGIIVESEVGYYESSLGVRKSAESEPKYPVYFQNFIMKHDDGEISTGRILFDDMGKLGKIKEEEGFTTICRVCRIELTGDPNQTMVDGQTLKSVNNSLFIWQSFQPHLEPIELEGQVNK